MFLRGLSPFGPIFGKELRTAARRRRNYVLRVVYLIGLFLFLLLAWTLTRESHGSGVAARAQQQGQLGFMFFAFFSMFCIGAMGLIGPVLTSTAINGERQAKTFHVLLMTPLTAWQIVSGKLFSRLLTALTLIGLSLPVLALVRLLGGVELEQMFAVVALCATTAMFGAAVGLLLSIIVKRAYAVIILAYMLMAFIYFFAPLLIASLFRDTWARVPWLKMLGTYNPFYAAGILGWGEWRRIPVDWVSVVSIHIIATAVVLAIASILVRQLARREGEGATPALDPALTPLQPANDDPTEFKPPLKSRGLIERDNRTVSDSPVLWRELSRPLLTKRWQKSAATLGTCGLLAVAYAAAYKDRSLDNAGFQIFLSFCFYTLLMLIVCVLSATSITQEKEGESWTVLLASPISGQQIVWAKALGVLRRCLWPMLLVVLHFVIFTAYSVISLPEMILALFVIASFNTIWVATGVAISLRFRKVTAAVITNLALPVALYGAGSLVLAVIDALLDAGNHLFDQVTWYLPYYYFAEGMIGSHYYRTTRELRGIRENVSMETFLLVAVTVGCLHILAAAGLLAWTAASFNAIVGRAPQRDPLLPQSPAKTAI